ncbi:MAG TPA: polysaccharide deacetylase family protein [Candidatus Thalassarchaeaceae archaeon]|nr:polysaccharide deacetylase family protein [Candidatus Thalassarchaeaceae archaeon]
MTNLHWFSIDSDDLHHHPSISGHPSRSSESSWCLEIEPRPMSNTLATSFESLQKWWISRPEDDRLTIFIIGEQVADPRFVNAIQSLISSRAGLTIGIHGLNHICWSAWGKCSEEFSKAIKQSISAVEEVAGESFRPWFRAPGGYIAPWMASILSENGIILDSSINSVRMLRSKTGRDESGRIHGWKQTLDAIEQEGIVEREWLTSKGIPINGPALRIPVLRIYSRWIWKRTLSESRCATEKELEDPSSSISSLYWHVLDHSRNSGRWTPPIV